MSNQHINADTKTFDRSNEFQAYYDKAWRLCQENRGEEALAGYVMEIKNNPYDVEAWLNKSVVLTVMSRDKEAAEAFYLTSKLAPDNICVLVCKGIRYECIGHNRINCPALEHYVALKAYRRAVRIDPGNANAWSYYANILYTMDRPRASLRAAERAIEIDQKNILGWTCKINALQALGRDEESDEESLAACDRFIETVPNDPDSWTTKALYLMLEQSHEEALKLYERALEIDPDDYTANCGKKAVLRELERA